MEVFRPDSLARLSSADKADVSLQVTMTDGLNKDYLDLSYSFSKEDEKAVKISLWIEAMIFRMLSLFL